MSSLVIRRRLRARRQQRQSNILRILLLVGLGIVALGAATVAASLATVFAIYQHYAKEYVPITEQLRLANFGLTEIYDRGGPEDGEFLGALTNPEAQLLNPIPLEEISETMALATISTEDNSFYDNPGINLRGLIRAAYENYVKGDSEGSGGSSITQQLIKNVYICPNVRSADDQFLCVSAERTLDRKLREIAYAIELTEDYSKDQILEWYLNQISYAGQYVGIQAAAQGYFHKDAIDLTLAESALLAGIPQAPTLYHPRLNCARNEDTECLVDEEGRTTVVGEAKARQEFVLDLMVDHGRITQAEAEEAKLEPLRVYQATNPLKASAFIDNQIEPRLVRMCEAGWLRQIPGSNDCTDSVHAAGYKVTTTLDWELTAQATQLIQQFVEDGLERGCECHNGSIVTIDPGSGQIMVYAPNRDPSELLNRKLAGDIDQLTEINQPGSAFKPVVYLTWFDEGPRAPMTVLWDTSPLEITGVVEIVNPRPPDPGSEGLISARAGLGGSQNVPAFRAAAEAGVNNVIRMAKALGITTLDQHFDPTFLSHDAVEYGATIATGGANIRAIDMAYMNATIANMGLMVGTPHLAKTIDPSELQSFFDEDVDRDETLRQSYDFSRGHTRLSGTRELDPVVILEVRDIDGNIIFQHTHPEVRQAVDASSVWLLHSIMSDCTARFIIWGCGSTNGDLGLDFFMADGQRVTSGVKTGTQQGPLDAKDTLETWMTGYSRHAATVVWIGNSDNSLVYDGPRFASARTSTTLWKTWMGMFHDTLQDRQIFVTPKGFDDLQPGNVQRGDFETPSTDRAIHGEEPWDPAELCEQSVTAWYRTDVEYQSQCEPHEVDTRNGQLASNQTPAQFREERFFVILPGLKPDLAEELAEELGLPIAPTEASTGNVAVSLITPTDGKILTADTPIVGIITIENFRKWRVEYGDGSNPSEWVIIVESEEPPFEDVLGVFEVQDLEDGVYTIRFVVETNSGALTSSVTFNEIGRAHV